MKDVSGLKGVPETMLIPVWARAQETMRDDRMIEDRIAIDIVNSVEYDFSIFGDNKNFYKTQVGVAARTKILDSIAIDYIEKNPHGTIINIGAGLDTRSERLSLDNVKWFDLDLPEGIEIRKEFFEENENRKFISDSVLDLDWIDSIEDRENVLFIAEGIFMYFDFEQIRTLLVTLASYFTNSEIVFEAMDPIAIGKAKHHESVKKLKSSSEFKSGFRSGKEIEDYDNRLNFEKEWYHFDYGGARWKSMRLLWLIPRFKRMMKIIKIKIN
ncbi:MAG: class I SAM-dependent methyltransferase [Firmicutes bacterium]|jgi:O-methyltransferase involved in polyketide biosynthesis|nr:class I SAM-dependent methyltransferase [Bacillota bacterium]